MIVTVAIFLPVVVAFAAFVLDVGNGMEHHRHLQLQADAGVLAAGPEFTRCRTGPTAANAAIREKAAQYSGAAYNPQIGGADAEGRVQTVLNGPGYAGPDGGLGEPCETGFIDVKLTEKDSPPFINVIGAHDYHGHARLQALRVESSKNLLPIAVEDPTPKSARAIFIDESTGATLAEAPLALDGSQGNLAIWDNAAAPVAVPITAQHVGVRIALGGQSSTTCGETLVACYDSAAPNAGVLHIQGWTAAGVVSQNANGTQDSPLARSVTLYDGSCGDPYFSAASGTCTIGVRATVDFGGPAANVGGVLTAKVGGASYPLSLEGGGTFSTGTVIPVPATSGPVPVELLWEETKGSIAGKTCKPNGNPKECKGTFDVQQRGFSATPDRSGPIALAQVSEAGVAWTNSLQRCSTVLPSCSHGLVVKIGVKGTLGLSAPTDPPVHLRVVGGSQNQSLDCDPDISSLKDELATGCSPIYEPTTGGACPGTASALWGSPQPWHCVAVQTGTAANQVAAGLNRRILGAEKPSVCSSPNRWPDVRSGDPRIVYVIVTPFGAFTGSGSDTKPVVRFAAFYITGWNGQGGGFDNPCQGNGDETPDDTSEIVGRFIKYVETPNEGGTGEDPCDFGSLDVCAAVLVE